MCEVVVCTGTYVRMYVCMYTSESSEGTHANTTHAHTSIRTLRFVEDAQVMATCARAASSEFRRTDPSCYRQAQNLPIKFQTMVLRRFIISFTTQVHLDRKYY